MHSWVVVGEQGINWEKSLDVIELGIISARDEELGTSEPRVIPGQDGELSASLPGGHISFNVCSAGDVVALDCPALSN